MTRRRIFNLLCIASSLVFAALLLAWARSYHCVDDFALFHTVRSGGQADLRGGRLVSSLGCVGLRVGRWVEPDSENNSPSGLRLSHEVQPLPSAGYPVSGSFWNRIGFLFTLDRYSDPTESELAVWVAVPHWLLLWLSASLPASWLMRRRRDRLRRRLGLCVGCGYDIRATPDRCPECGADAMRPA